MFEIMVFVRSKIELDCEPFHLKLHSHTIFDKKP